MKITINNNTLAQELRLLSKIAQTKATLPILTHVLLRAEDQLYLSASDLEISMYSECAATVSEMGQMTLPAKSLLDMLERMPDADVTIDSNISSGAFRSRLGSLPPADFPTLPSVSGETVTLSAQALHALVERTIYAISDKEQKYVLKGALLSMSGDVVAMVATDGKRLSIATAHRQAGPDVTAIVPLKTLQAILDQPAVGDVNFTRTDRHLFFSYGKRLLISRVVDGEFPKYQRIIPKANTHVATIDRTVLASVVRRVGLVSEVMVCHLVAGELRLSARSMEIGDAAEAMPVTYEGPDVVVKLNWQFLLDFLEHAVESTISIAVKDNSSPLLLTDGADFINVLMVIK